MSDKYAAAIRWLQKMADSTDRLCKLIKESAPGRCADLRQELKEFLSAIRLLEAAGKVDKEKTQAFINLVREKGLAVTNEVSWCALWDLLAALPDEYLKGDKDENK